MVGPSVRPSTTPATSSRVDANRLLSPGRGTSARSLPQGGCALRDRLLQSTLPVCYCVSIRWSKEVTTSHVSPSQIPDQKPSQVQTRRSLLKISRELDKNWSRHSAVQLIRKRPRGVSNCTHTQDMKQKSNVVVVVQRTKWNGLPREFWLMECAILRD
ncbi:hypothetical protein CDAR_71771 [Caerostris darwini]|uniref:Uncharacterized protein n=1 Tax=Caerostris darwini TaxID=1538125 RepID=A0AAV4TFS7_9ARAC|nr:hypothetical protein CDAR_71771 [Caerostris darwini]